MLSARRKRKTMPSRMEATDVFAHCAGDLVLVRWKDERIYFAKIKSVSRNRRVCKIIFEDDEQVSVPFEDVYSVDSSADEYIVCIVCKFGTSDAPNQIVLCDKCGIAYHQLCHKPFIPEAALELSSPWVCRYCKLSCDNPHVKRSINDKKPFGHSARKGKGGRSKSLSETPIAQRLPLKKRRNTISGSADCLSARYRGCPSDRRPETLKNNFCAGRKKRTHLRQVLKAIPEQTLSHVIADSEKKPKSIPAFPGSEISANESHAKTLMFADVNVACPPLRPEGITALSDEGKLLMRAPNCPQSVSGELGTPQEDRPVHPEISEVGKTALSRTQMASPISPASSVDQRTLPFGQTSQIMVEAYPNSPPISPTGQSRFPGSISPKVFLSTPNDHDTVRSPFSPLSSPADMKEMLNDFDREHDNFMLGLSNKGERSDVTVEMGKLKLHQHYQSTLHSVTTTDLTTGHLKREAHTKDNVSLRKPFHKSEAVLKSEARQMLFNHAWLLLQKKGLAPFAGRPTVGNDSPRPAHVCVGCGRHAEYLCSVCQNTWYCSRQCQDQVYLLYCLKCVS